MRVDGKRMGKRSGECFYQSHVIFCEALLLLAARQPNAANQRAFLFEVNAHLIVVSVGAHELVVVNGLLVFLVGYDVIDAQSSAGGVLRNGILRMQQIMLKIIGDIVLDQPISTLSVIGRNKLPCLSAIQKIDR